MKLDIKEKVELPDGITATYERNIMTVKGPKGEASKTMHDPLITIKSEGNTINISCKKATKRQIRSSTKNR